MKRVHISTCILHSLETKSKTDECDTPLSLPLLNKATPLNPDLCDPDFRLNRTDCKVPVPSYTYTGTSNSYTHNPDFA